MPATYEPIATYTVPSATSSYTFSSIPSTYTDLILIINCSFTNTTAYPNPRLQLNGDASTTFPLTALYGTGAAFGSYRLTGYAYAYISASSGGASGTDKFIMQCNLQNYANTTTFKSMLYRVNSSSTETTVGAATWRSTSAISSIEISTQAQTFATGSTFTLYGIKAA